MNPTARSRRIREFENIDHICAIIPTSSLANVGMRAKRRTEILDVKDFGAPTNWCALASRCGRWHRSNGIDGERGEGFPVF